MEGKKRAKIGRERDTKTFAFVSLVGMLDNEVALFSSSD